MRRLLSGFLLLGLTVMLSCGEASGRERLADAIDNIDSGCPLGEDEAVTLRCVEDRISEVDYFHDVDESEIDMAFVRENIGDFWSWKRDGIMYDPSTYEIVPLLVENNKEVGFMTESGGEAGFKFSVDELRSMLSE